MGLNTFNKLFFILMIIGIFFASSCGFEEETNYLPENYGKNLSEQWDFTDASNYLYDNGIEISNGTAKLESNFFNTNWKYRIPITIDNSSNSNTLTNYQIKITINSNESSFWDNIETDGRSIRFTDEDNSTLLNFWIEKFDYNNQSAIIWVKIPQIDASSNKTIYLYYGNSSADNASDGESTFIFFDDFEDGDSSDWLTYSSGDVSRPPLADPDPPAGSGSVYSLEKINNSDPNGGYKNMNLTIGLGYIFEGRIYRPSSYNGGSADRLAIEDSSYNGYGFIVNHYTSGSYIEIERRDAGTGNAIGSSVTYDPPEDSWYKFKFEMIEGGTFNFFIYNMNDVLLSSVSNVSDSNYSNFSIVIVHGGYEYYIDDLRIRKYTSPEPTVTLDDPQTVYSNSNPTLTPKNGVDFSNLNSFEHTLGQNNQGTVKYQISNDGVNWYYWNGSAWQIAENNYTYTNTEEEINNHLNDFVDEIGKGTFYFKAYFISDGTQQVELENVTLNYKR